MIPVTKTHLPELELYIEQLHKIWESRQLTNNGELSIELANRLREFLGVANLQLVANGTMALQLAIKALGLRGEIITTPYSYVATSDAIAWEGCTPVFVDIETDSFNIDPELIEAAITEDTCAILATHVYGIPCDLKRIREIAGKYGLKVIYDGAHSFGVEIDGQSLLSAGDISITSFHATKLFHTCEGGAVICSSAEVDNTVDLMKRFGHRGEDDYFTVGINAKMSELHAAMGLCVLPDLQQNIEARRVLSQNYDISLSELKLILPESIPGLKYNYSYYPVLFPTHEKMLEVKGKLQNEEIFARRYFYPSLNRLSYFCGPAGARSCPVAEDVSNRILCLPLYPDLEIPEVENICNIVSRCLK